MKKNILSFLLMSIVVFGSLMLNGCAYQQKMYKLEDIESISYSEEREYGEEISGVISADEITTIKLIYSSLENVNYNKTRQKKDFWTQKPIEYKTPKTYAYILVSLKNGGSKGYYFFANGVFPSLNSMEYSEKGFGAADSARAYLVDKDLLNQ
jgi:hypothetical protein